MSSVLGQIGQGVADSLVEIGQSTVKGTVGAVADIASESVEQITSSTGAGTQTNSKPVEKDVGSVEQRKERDRRRFEEVRAELSQYVQRKRELDRKIAEEKMAQDQEQKQEHFVEKKKHDSWVNNIINRSQTTTEKGKMVE